MCYSLKEGSGADLRVRDIRGLQTFGCVLVSQKLLLVLFCFTASAYMFIVVSIFCTSHLVVVPVHNTQRNYQTFLKVESVFPCNNFQISLFLCVIQTVNPISGRGKFGHVHT